MSTPRSLTLPPGVRRVSVRTPRGDLVALAADPAPDAAGDPVLLVPGFTGSKEDFLPILEPIAAAGHRVLAIDQRGQYESSGGEDPSSYDVKALADDVLAVAAGLGDAVHLVGHSFGGLVTRAAAMSEPTAVRSLVLVGSGPAAIPHPAASNLALMVEALPAMPLADIWIVKRQMELSGHPGPAPDIEEFLQRRFLANSPEALRAMAQQLLTETDCIDELARVDVPTLVVYGVDDDAWPPASQREMAARLGAPVVEIPDAGHSPAVDNPHEMSAVLLRFWSKRQAD